MEDNLKKQILDAVESQLPKMTGEAIKKLVEQHEKLQKDHESALATITERNKEVSKLEKRISTLTEDLAESRKLNATKEQLDERERQLDLTKLKYELQCEKDKTSHVLLVMDKLTRNTIFREKILGVVPEHVAAAANSYGSIERVHGDNAVSLDQEKEAE